MPLGVLRDRVLLETAYVCGARASEVCGMHVEDLDLGLDDEHARVHGKGGTVRTVLVGYCLLLGLVAFVQHDFGITVVKIFPVLSVPVALVAVVLVTLLVVRPTLRRAVRIDPGRVLRYE